MITQVSIKNFKCLRDVTVSLEPFTVFVGANGSGKTSVLQALDMLCRAFRSPKGDWEGEFRQRQSRGAKDEVEVAAVCDEAQYRFRTQAGTGVLNPRGARLGGPNHPSWSQWPTNPVQPNSLPQSVLLQLETSKLVQSAAAGPDPTVMNADGSGLHTALAGMALNEPDTWPVLQQHFRQIIPNVRRVRHTKKGELLFDIIGADSLLANQVSEGTLLVLGILAAVYGTSRPALLLLDDIDRGLHPLAQKELIDLLRGLLATMPDLQIAATTHSPYLLDSLRPNEVRMTTLREDGSTACEPLTRHPKFKQWKDEMAPGEMWSFFGEKWVAEPEVAAE